MIHLDQMKKSPLFRGLPPRRRWIFAAGAATVVMGGLIVKNAWISDDAFITFRTVDNALAGYGLVYNVGERVQSYTHPLWMMLLVLLKALFGELYYATIGLSVLLSLAAFGMVIQSTSGSRQVLLTAIALTSSKAFMDYTTSGLENPLTYLLMGLYIVRAPGPSPKPKSLFIASLIGSLAALNRLDTLLMTLPLLAYLGWTNRSMRSFTAILLGQLPLLLWTLFSLVYYGAPVANTVYAKLDTGVPTAILLAQGTAYFAEVLRHDPATLFTIFFGVGLGIFTRRGTNVFLSLGIALYLFYIIYVGGDFMAGRFLSAPLLATVALTARHSRKWRAPYVGVACTSLLVLSLPSVHGNLLSGPRYGEVPLVETEQFGPLPLSLIDESGISDERGFYYPATGLLRPDGGAFPSHQWARWGKEKRSGGSEVVVGYAIGMFGYYAGPQIHVIDTNALNDFLLARLPVPRGDIPRIGHFARELPSGYYETVLTGENQIKDPSLAEFYNAVRLVTQAPLFSEGRINAIWKMNTGSYRLTANTDW